MDPRPTLCIVNYNGIPHLPASLTAAYPLRDRFSAILLIDNASDDESLAFTRRHYPAIRPIPLRRNGGPAVARNVGFALAPTSRILFIDNDVSLAEGCVDRLMEALDAHPAAAVAMPRVLYAHDPATIQFEGAGCHLLGLMTLQSVDTPTARGCPETRALDSVVTACILVDRDRWGAGRPFAGAFRFNYEDHDFGVHTRLRGRAILAVPAARVYHGGGTAGLSMRGGRPYARLRVYLLIRNRWLIVLTYYQRRTLALLAPLLALYELAQLAVAVRKGWLGEWLAALAWIVANLPAVLARRRQAQRARAAPDRDFLRGGPLPLRPELAGGRIERLAQAWLNRVVVAYGRIVTRWL